MIEEFGLSSLRLSERSDSGDRSRSVVLRFFPFCFSWSFLSGFLFSSVLGLAPSLEDTALDLVAVLTRLELLVVGLVPGRHEGLGHPRREQREGIENLYLQVSGAGSAVRSSGTCCRRTTGSEMHKRA